jgi:hypothetical protein
MSGDTRTPTINLHIESLVLRGFDRLDPAALSTALQEALTRELGSVTTLRDLELPQVRATVNLPERFGVEHLGGALAETLSGIAGSSDATNEPRHD